MSYTIEELEASIANDPGTVNPDTQIKELEDSIARDTKSQQGLVQPDSGVSPLDIPKSIAIGAANIPRNIGTVSSMLGANLHKPVEREISSEAYATKMLRGEIPSEPISTITGKPVSVTQGLTPKITEMQEPDVVSKSYGTAMKQIGKGFKETADITAKYWKDTLSPKAKALSEESWYKAEGIFDKGVAATLAASQSAPDMLVTGLVGAPIAATAKGLKVASLLGKGLQKIGVSSKIASKVAPWMVEGAAYGTPEGVTAGLGNADSVSKYIDKMSYADLIRSPLFQEYVNKVPKGRSVDEQIKTATEALKQDAMLDVVAETTGASTATGMVFGAGLFGSAGASKNWVLRRLYGGAKEGFQETGQSGLGEQLPMNLTAQEFLDSAQKPMEGVGEAALEGAGPGFIMGLLGGSGGKAKIHPERTKALDAANKVLNKTKEKNIKSLKSKNLTGEQLEALKQNPDLADWGVTPSDIQGIIENDKIKTIEAANLASMLESAPTDAIKNGILSSPRGQAMSMKDDVMLEKVPTEQELVDAAVFEGEVEPTDVKLDEPIIEADFEGITDAQEEQQTRQAETQAEEITTERGEEISEEILPKDRTTSPDTSPKKATVSEQIDIPIIQELEDQSRALGAQAQQAEKAGDQKKADELYVKQDEIDAQIEAQPIDVEEILATTKTAEQLDYDLQSLREQQMEAEDAGHTETANDLTQEVVKVEAQAAIVELQEIKDSLEPAIRNEEQLKRKEDEIDSLQKDIDTLIADKSVGPQGKTKRAAKVTKYRQEQIMSYFKQAQGIPLENRTKESLQKEYEFWVQNAPPSGDKVAVAKFEKETGLDSQELLNRMKKIGSALRGDSKQASTQQVEGAEAISTAEKKDSKQESDTLAPETVKTTEKEPKAIETVESLQTQAKDLQAKIDRAIKQKKKRSHLREQLSEVESKLDDLRVETVETMLEQPLTKTEEKVESEEITPEGSIKLIEYKPLESDTIKLGDIFSTTLVQAQKESDAKMEQYTKATYEAGKKSKDKNTRKAAELMSRLDPDGVVFTRGKYTQTSSWISKMLSSPEYTFLKDPAATKVVRAAQDADQVKFEIQKEVMGDFIETAEAFKKYDPKGYKKAGKYLREGDRTGKGFRLKKTGDKWYGYNPKGVRIFEDEHREAASEALIEAEQEYLKGRMDKDTREFVKLFRELMGRSLYAQNLDLQSQIDNAERYGLEEPRVSDPESPTIAEAIAQSGDLEGTYFPRIRLNKEYYIRMSKEGKPDVLFTTDLMLIENLEGSDTLNKIKRVLNKGTFSGHRINKLKKQGYTLVEAKPGKSPSELVFDVPGLLSSMETMLGQAEDSAKTEDELKVIQHMNDVLTKNIADVYKAKGNLSSKLQRSKSFTEGFEEDPIKAAVSHAQRISAGIAKRQTARDMLLAFTGRDQSFSDFLEENPGSTRKDYAARVAKHRIHESEQKELFADVRTYMTHVLKPNSPMARALGYLKAATVVKYLGFRVSSAAINMSNMVAAVPATMSAHSGVSLVESFKLVTEASTKYAAYRSQQPTFKSYKQKGWSKWLNKLQRGTKATGSVITKPVKLTDADYKIFDTISAKGWDEAHFNIDATRAIQDYAGTKYNQLIGSSMYMFGAAEKANRAMTIFAAYKAHQQKNPDLAVEELLELAHHTSDRAHGSYGKATKPYLVQKYPVLDLAYMFTKFQHNYVLNMLEIGFKRKDIPAALHMITSPAVIAGAGASILAQPAAWALEALGIGGDDPEEEFYAYMEKNLGDFAANTARHGIVGGAFNINFKGSMQSPLADISKIKDASIWSLMGAPGGVIKDEWEAAMFFKHKEWSKGFEKAFPSALGTPLKAIRLWTEGATTKGYAPKFFGQEQTSITLPEVALMTMAFNPAAPSARTEKQWHEKLTKMSYKKDRDKINRAMRRYTLRGSKLSAKQVVEIQSMMNDYNDRVSNSSPTLNEKFLSWSKLHQNLRQSMKPSAYERAR